MKTIVKVVLIAFCSGSTVSAVAQEKKYIMVDMLDSLDKRDERYSLNRYTLKTKELYGVDETIELYNVHLSGLILFSVLPDFTGNENWSEVTLADIRNEVFDERTFRSTMEKHILSESSTDKKTMQYSLVKTDDGKYFKSNFCLAEFFFMDDYPSLFNVPFGTINIQQDLLSIRQMMDVYWDSLNIPEHWSFPLDVRQLGGTLLLPNRRLLQREYLSRELDIKDEPAYQFWTFTDWNSHDTYNLHRGIDRFIYMPGKGIVGGSYDFYFLFEENWGFIEKGRDRHAKTKDELWENILEEKVMLAEELK